MKTSILFYHWNNRLTGSVINLFEYFLKIYELNKEAEIIFINGNVIDIKNLLKIVYDRYNIDDLKGFENNIRIVSRYKMMAEKLENVLILDYGTISKTKGFISPKNLIVISEKYTSDPNFFFSKELYNVTYYGEMPFHYRDKEYRMKFLFDRYKKLKNVDEAIFLNSPHNHDFSFVEDLELPDKPIIYKTRSHRDNLFEKFDTFVYYHADKWFDPHPRLFVESKFYDKDIIYFNHPNIIDGSYYRYNDVLENGIDNRNMTKNDEVIGQLI